MITLMDPAGLVMVEACVKSQKDLGCQEFHGILPTSFDLCLDHRPSKRGVLEYLGQNTEVLNIIWTKVSSAVGFRACWMLVGQRST